VNATSDTIAKVLLELLEMPDEEFLSLKHRSRRFVERWHDPVDIARRLRLAYEQHS
jgi:hypothetical protein